MHETPRLSAKFSSYDPFKTARLNQAGGKNKLCHSCGVTATLATKNHISSYSLLRDQEVACSLKPSPEVANSGGPFPARSVPVPGPSSPSCGLVPVARSRWPGPGSGGPIPVARSRWPGPGGPVPVAWSGGPVPVPVPLQGRVLAGPREKRPILSKLRASQCSCAK